jgi:hypothetical protein
MKAKGGNRDPATSNRHRHRLALEAVFLSRFIDRVSLFDLESRFFAPTRSIAKPARAGACAFR